MKNAFRLIPAVIAVFILAGCSEDITKSGDVSSATGWAYNQEESGGFQVKEAEEQETGPGLQFIEGGTFTMGKVQDDVLYEWNNIPKRVTVASFYMDKTEVTNVHYREYLYWLKRIYLSDEANVAGNTTNRDIFTAALPDTLVWRDVMAFNEDYVNYYFRHPAYNEYPVVGVSWLQAVNYAAWRSDRVNEQRLVDLGYFDNIATAQTPPDPTSGMAGSFDTEAFMYQLWTHPDNADAGRMPELNPSTPAETRAMDISDGVFLPNYRLPTEAEWEFAALGLIGNSVDELVWERKNYPWNGHNVRNDSPKDMGQMRANFVRGSGDMMGVAGSLNDKGSVTVPVKSYWPNDYGLYCMAGNVSEWVLDVYRPMSFEDVSGFRPFRGNVFKKIDMDENGQPRIDSLGNLMRVDIDEKDAQDRYNYRKADYRNYQDGDARSVMQRGNLEEEEYENSGGTGSMYVFNDTEQTSLISDEVRVYKGGSWKDRAYWLSPGERRFLKQSASRDDIGFRCAMSRVGSPEGFSTN